VTGEAADEAALAKSKRLPNGQSNVDAANGIPRP
jgi:hypothetical protein